MEENETVKRLQQALSERIQQCSDMRTLIDVLELLEGGFPTEFDDEEDSEDDEPPAKSHSGFRLTPAHIAILDERQRQIDCGEVNLVPWELVNARLLDGIDQANR